MSIRKEISVLVSFILIGLFSLNGFAQQTESINWMSLDEAWQKSKIEKRKILVEMYTEWCEWCKKMESETFAHEKVIRYINEKYYPVRFNGEYKGDITFKGKTYSFVEAGRSFFSGKTTDKDYHELAAMLTEGKISYPTIIFLDEEFDTIQSLKGFKEPRLFLAFLNYVGQNYQEKIPWNQFLEQFDFDQ